MNISPKITSKTYYIYLSKSFRLNLLRRTWLSFLALTLVLSPIAGVLWNLQRNTALADTAVYGFAKGMGGTGSDQGNSVKLDDDGNIYTTGQFSGTSDFDPGAGTSNLISAGLTDIYISKLDSDGDLVWAKKIGGTGSERSNSIVVDTDGNSYITGMFEGTVDFDPGAGTSNLVAGLFQDIFVAKLDVDGNFVWAKSFAGGGNGFYDEGTFVTLDDDNNVYSTGTFDGTADFDPGAGTANLSSSGGLGQRDTYISKLDVDGNYVWAKAFLGASDTDTGRAIVLDSSGNVYTTGTFRGQVDFDPGAGSSAITSFAGNDVFVSKLDSSGNYVWAKQMGGTSSEYGNDIKLGSDGNLYISGPMGGNGDYDPGAGTATLLAADGGVFISVLDSSGSYVSATNFGAGASYATAYRMILDGDDNIYIIGYFGSTADFEPGSGTTNKVSLGGYDIFLAKYDSEINLSWVQSFGSAAGNEYGYDITLDSSDNIYSTGDFTNTVDFDPGSSTSNLVSAGSDDIYISKLSPQADPTVTVSSASLVTQGSATLNGNITSLGGPENSATRGFEYGLTDSYGTTVTQSDGSYTTGAFSAEVTGLACSTTYYFRAFATNSSGTGYSSGSSQSTAGCPSSGSHSNASQAQNQSPAVVPSPTPTTPTIDLLSPASLGSPSNPFNPKSPTNSTLIPSTERFLRNLGFGSTGEDVKRLQQFLNVNEYTLSNTGAGSPSNETTFFGPRTKAAVKVFQETFASQILTPLGLTQGTGYFGESTRGFVNSLLP